MAERPWRVDVAPVHRAGWSDDAAGVATGTPTRPVAIGRRRTLDQLLVAAIAAGLLVALAKPWGPAPLPQVAPPAVADVAKNVPGIAASAAIPVPVQAPDLPTALFAPAASTCMQDVGWRVCVLGGGGAADQATRNHFAPDAVPLTDAGGAAAPADPVVVLATATGGTLAFYAPNGFYIPDSQQVPRPTDEPDGKPAIASGPVSISAWHLDGARGSRTLPLLSAGPVTAGGRVAANVFVAASDAFSALAAWPAGRYIVWITGAGSRTWQEFFDFDVVGEGPITPR